MARSMRILRPSLALALAALTSPAWAQVPAGGEFRANVVTTGGQARPSVAIDPNGGMVVVWDARNDPGYDIVGRRFDARGRGLGGEFKVNVAGGVNYGASVSMDARGD